MNEVLQWRARLGSQLVGVKPDIVPGVAPGSFARGTVKPPGQLLSGKVEGFFQPDG